MPRLDETFDECHPAQEWKSADDDGAGHYTCIICGAKPGHQCYDRSGTEYNAVHAERGEVGKLPPPENCSQCGRFVAWKDYTADDWTVQGHAKGTGCRKNDH